MPTDPFAALGISRRPAFRLFGTPDTSQPGFTRATEIAAMEDEIIKSNQQALRDRQDALAAEQQYFATPPNARQKFLEENPVITKSPKFGEIMQYQGVINRGPSFSDEVLFNKVVEKIPVTMRGRFTELVQQGVGVNQARDQVELEIEDNDMELKLIESGIHPDEVKQYRDPQTGFIDPKKATWAMSQRKSLARTSDPTVAALEDNYRLLMEEAKDALAGDNPERDAEIASIRKRLLDARRAVYDKVTPAATTPPATGSPQTTAPQTSADAKRALLQKLGITKQ